jgi:serine/threonine-protein kinase
VSPAPKVGTYTPSAAAGNNSAVVAIALSAIGLIIAIGLGFGALFITQQNQQQIQLAEARREAEQAKERQQQLEKEKIEAETQQRIAEAQRQSIQTQQAPEYRATTPMDNVEMTDGTAVGVIENLYAALSAGQWTEAQQYHAPNTRDQFDPQFFAKFQRVTVSDLKIASRTSDSLNLIGTNTFVWPDGSIQREERSFTVTPGPGGQPIITSSEFMRVLKPRN